MEGLGRLDMKNIPTEFFSTTTTFYEAGNRRKGVCSSRHDDGLF